MINPRILLLILMMAVSTGYAVIPSIIEFELTENWQFKKQSDSTWYQATVPGTVHTDLIALGKIKDPYYRLNEHDLQWIDKENWEYQTTFSVSKTLLSKPNIELDFSGLDTYAKVYLNNSLILESDNMFRTYTVDVKSLLTDGNNHLRILFESPIKKGIEKYDSTGYKLPVSDNDLAAIGKVQDEKQVSIYSRKAGYHFGWDWGPRLVTSGIWRPIKLKSWDHHTIDDLFIEQNSLDEQAHLTAHLEITADKACKDVSFEINVNKNLVKIVTLELSTGKNSISIPFEIDQPKRWWPNGMGKQNLYNIEVIVTGNDYQDFKSHPIGLRTIELVTEPDSIGASFYFKINGTPLFMKGANYIPQDVFLTRATSARYEQLLNAAKTANMNMLRVWGGGIYENDEFYTLCDQKGLLVWQDFMFACAMFPGDRDFLDNVKQEAIDNIKRLRNHTSIALWCGNNEILSAWENWGWEKKVIEKQSQEIADTIWKAYDDIFHKILPEAVSSYDNTRSYWPSSPGSEFGKKESLEKGDAHYWMVWWGKHPFDTYNTVIPRFMSEYGFQSFPAFSSVKKYTLPKDHDVYSDVMKSHQRSSIGNVTIEEYMIRHYRKPKDFESFLYVSQLLQAHGIKTGIEAHRRNRSRCMGSLYWQINDCWPVASWSSIDYYGKWKALHYTVKKSFENFLISYADNEKTIDIHVVSDSLKDINAQMKIRILDFEGKELKQWEKSILITANNANVYFSLPKKGILTQELSKKILIHTQLIGKEGILTENTLYLSPFKDLLLPLPELTYSIKEEKNRFAVHIKTKNLAKNVFLSTGDVRNLSDNYFDLLPNSERVIYIPKNKTETLASIIEHLNITTLIDSFNK